MCCPAKHVARIIAFNPYKNLQKLKFFRAEFTKEKREAPVGCGCPRSQRQEWAGWDRLTLALG